MAEQNKFSSMLAVGTILHGTFRIDRYLASGGFGNTYVATNINFNETYVVKEFFMKGVSQRGGDSVTVSVSNADNMATFDSQKRKFKKEAIRLRKLHNPHIVHVHDLFEENGTIYYVMDFIDGTSLRDIMAKTGEPMPESRVLDILRQVLDALDTVHKLDIYHLDLKPANIMLNKQNVAIVIDFGASKQLSRDDEASTSTGISYTNGYAPTEQIERNLDKIGPWTDFYALGATLYNLLTAQKPPMPSDVLYDETPDKHLSLPMPPTVSPKTRKLVLWMMQGNRNKRPQSVQEIYDYLDKKDEPVKKEEPAKPKPIGRSESEDTIITTGKPAVKEGPVVNKPKVKIVEEPEEPEYEEDNGKHGLIVKIAVGVVCFLIIFFGWQHFSGSSSKDTADSTELSDTTATAKSDTESVTDFKYSTKKNTYLWTGTVKDSVPTGHGTAKFCKYGTTKEDGRVFNGTMVKGIMESSKGTFSFANGDTFKGSFTNDHFSRGTYTIAADGSYFFGKFNSAGQPLQGKWYDKNGNMIQSI